MEDKTDEVSKDALNKEVGGTHYKSAYQPIQLMERVRMYACCSYILKYVYRHKSKGGRQDLEKALHCCELMEQLGSEWYRGNVGMFVIDTSHMDFHKFIKLNKQLDGNQIRAILAICDKDMDVLKRSINDEILSCY